MSNVFFLSVLQISVLEKPLSPFAYTGVAFTILVYLLIYSSYEVGKREMVLASHWGNWEHFLWQF